MEEYFENMEGESLEEDWQSSGTGVGKEGASQAEGPQSAQGLSSRNACSSP